MDLNLRGKKVIVLGGTRGIGRKIAETLAGEGCDIGLCARNGDQVAEAVSSMKTFDVKATGASVDIADGAALKSWITDAGNELDGIDILVSNASALAIGADEESWQKGLDIDVLGAVRSFEAAAPFLEASAEKNGDAAFVAIASVSSISAQNPSAYGAVKAALIHYMKGVAKQWASKHVRANVVSPGTVYFEGGVWHMIEQGNPEMFKQTMARNPMGRMATPQDIADAAAFLASPRSSFTTGINMLIDGAISDRVNY